MGEPIPSDPFRALADPTRREILELLRGGARPVQELAARFPQMSRPAVSKHLRILRQAGLVTETRNGRHRIYRLEIDALQAVSGWLAEMDAGAPTRQRSKKPARPAARRKSRVAEVSPAESASERAVETPSESPAEEDPRDWKNW